MSRGIYKIMLGLKDKEKREEIGFIVKTTITVVAAIFAVIFGTSHLAKIDQEQSLKAKLIGSTEIKGLSHGPYVTLADEGLFCDVSGSYQIENTGKYPFIVDEVRIELWEVPYISDSALSREHVTSYSLSERMQAKCENPAKRVGNPVVIKVGEQFGVKNMLQRSFGFIVPISQAQKIAMDKGVGSRFVVVANATARLDDRKPWYRSLTHAIAGDPGIEFLPNDLRHISGTFNICEKHPIESNK